MALELWEEMALITIAYRELQAHACYPATFLTVSLKVSILSGRGLSMLRRGTKL
jgi:hypothetical protein